MTTDDLHRIYELEALLAQALTILIQVDDAVKALKPAQKSRKKLSHDAMMKNYQAIVGRSKQEKRTMQA